jgi:DNA-binding NarL/FixJ family response regulator
MMATRAKSVGMLKVVLADNQTIFRAGAAKVLAVEDEVRIVAQAQSAEQMYMALERFRPGVLVAAASVEPDIEKLVRAASKTQTRLVVIGENGDPTARFTSCGVGGVVYRNVNGQALLDCVQAVAAGKSWLQDGRAPEPESDQDMVGARVRDRLTPKELRIVALIVQGYKNKEIATQLGTTEQVIKNYLRNVYDKIGVSDRLELALFTLHHRILAEAAAATTTMPAASASARVH